MSPFILSASTADPGFIRLVPTVVIVILLGILIYGSLIYLFILIIKALRKYLRSGSIQKENAAMFQSLGEALKSHRLRCGMTQEFVAEQLGVSRQAVSKWENGTSDPSTTNLLKLCKLYHISPEDLLNAVQPPEE